ncbi:MAG: protein translocase subunit SecD [Armatimonadetes bacterium]|nr:protein translocase subunit SecD [Armatimonadota bacterium]
MTKYQKYFIGVVTLAITAGIIISQMSLVKGLDIAGGIRVVLQADPKNPEDWPKTHEGRMEKMASIRKTIQNRVKGIGGVTEPVVVVQGEDRLVVELPGVKDPDKALRDIKSTAALEFYYLKDVQNANNPMGKWRMDVVREEDRYIFTGPLGESIDSVKQPEEVLEKVVDIKRNKPILTGKDLLSNAKAGLNARNQTVVNIEFNREGTMIFREFTRRHVGDYLAVFFDGKLLTAPSINEPIPSGKAEITGFRSLAEAKQVADYLNAGALPVPLKVIAKDSVEPTLGMETVQKVIMAGIIGLLAVIVFMLIYYRLPGAIADVALCLYAMFVIAVFMLIRATMSLAGFAALIISIGMAVDANILIFERLKEELKSGKTLRAAIDTGFTRAFTAIFDSNMCTAITCAILMWYGTPSVQSFAFTLLIGVAISMFTAITVTRTILHLLVNWEWAQNPKWYGLGTSWFARSGRTLDIVGKRNYYFLLSACLIIPGLVILGTSGLKKGIEFRSGTSIQASFVRPVTLSEVRSIAAKYSPGLAPQVQLSKVDGQKKVAFIKTAPLSEEKDVALRDELDRRIGLDSRSLEIQFKEPVVEKKLQQLVARYSKWSTAHITDPKPRGENKTALVVLRFVPEQKWLELRKALDNAYTIVRESEPRKTFDSVSTVEPTISEELTRNAVIAVIFASVAIVVYLSMRFAIGGIMAGLKFGTCAVIALVHDSAFILGMFAILGKVAGWEIDSLFVTAVLTIIGFSVHDTIVVFDRIRENLRHRLRGETFEQLCNRSILQTFSRSINTSLTVVLTLVSLIAFGGPLLRHFYVALLAGIIIGTYSSIFNATPLVIVWEKIASKTAEPKRRAIEEKPLVASSGSNSVEPPPSTAAPAASVSSEEVVAEEEPSVQMQTSTPTASKPAKIKRKAGKKKRF